MGEVKHTPGPWIYYADLPSTEPNWHIVTTANKLRVLANVHIEPGNRMDEANARLIAAAPGLLEALESIAMSAGQHGERGTTGDGHQQAIQTARAAIQRATGDDSREVGE